MGNGQNMSEDKKIIYMVLIAYAPPLAQRAIYKGYA